MGTEPMLSAPGIRDLAVRAFDAFHEVDEQWRGVVVRPAVPILWFGDLEAYRSSPLRVLTVGLNPSRAEFPVDEPFRRFRSAARVDDVTSAEACEQYVLALSRYFDPSEDPYTSWFRSFEPLLNGLGVSYYPAAEGTALHTDICSPIATDPTWSGLPDGARESLIRPGRALWHDLVRELRPHVIVVSVAKDHLSGIEFAAETDWSTVHTVDRTNPYDVRSRTVRIDGDHSAILVFGRAAQKPFGLISDDEKRRAGASIRGGMHG